ncbi:MAG: hypothetical protein LBM96_10055 [Methanobrevibacter sp.]|jgi:tetratricopeptide (TPR) repeat protein|nr:hypothetical protein [Candidatus Methanoflexus mossambicus]
MSKSNKEKLERKLEKAIKHENHAKIIKIADKLSKLEPEISEYHLVKAKIYEDLNKYDKLVESCKDAINAEKNNLKLRCEIVDKFESLGLLDEAFETIEEGLKIDSNNFDLIETKIILSYNNNHVDDAYEYMDKFSKNNDNSDRILILKARIKEFEKDHDSAIEIYNKILTKGENPDALYERNRVMNELNLDIDEINNALKSFYNNEKLKNVAALITAENYINHGKEDEAIPFIDNFYKDDLENEDYTLTKGKILLDLGKVNESEEYLLNAAKLRKTDDEYEANILVAMLFIDNGYLNNALNLVKAIPKNSATYETGHIIGKLILNRIREKKEMEKFKDHPFLKDINLDDNAMEIIQNNPQLRKKFEDIIGYHNNASEDTYYKNNSFDNENSFNESIQLRNKKIIDNKIDNEEYKEEYKEKYKKEYKEKYKEEYNEEYKEEYKEKYGKAPEEVSELINQAQKEKNPKKRIELAKKAIKLDKYAIDAYNILANETSNNEDRLNYLKTAIDMFYENNDTQYLKEISGHFYEIKKTKPFMQAMQAYGDTLELMERDEEAMETFELMLELNPKDDQGIRYALINSFLQFNKLDKVIALIEKFENEKSTQFLFSKLLWAIKSKKDEKTIEKYYKNAINENKNVVPILLRKKGFPELLPQYYSPGDENEAAIYIVESIKNWNSDKLYLDTLKKLYDKFN